jgi:peptidyl-tRNA hydrolase, PTH1 family
MGLFQKKPQVSSSAPLYTLGLSKTVLVVGLGNIGKKYDGTRHNIGFECVDFFAEKADLGTWVEKKDLKCRLVNGMAGDTRVIAIKPTTFMNLSGEAVQAVMHFYKIPLNQVIVVHDELDIPFGQIRTRVGGSSAGNNGIKSLIQHIGEEFARVRIGVRNELADTQDSADFVLEKFNREEDAQLNNLKKEATSILTEYTYGNQVTPETRSFIV